MTQIFISTRLGSALPIPIWDPIHLNLMSQYKRIYQEVLRQSMKTKILCLQGWEVHSLQSRPIWHKHTLHHSCQCCNCSAMLCSTVSTSNLLPF